MAVISRILMVIIGYALACVAASFVLTLGTLAPDWDYLTSLNLQSATVWFAVGIGAVIVGVIAGLPALLIVVLAEGFRWRSVILYAILGAVVALVLSYGGDFAGYVGTPNSFLAREREVLAAAGIAGGFVYWLFAGRRAGAWK